MKPFPANRLTGVPVQFAPSSLFVTFEQFVVHRFSGLQSALSFISAISATGSCPRIFLFDPPLYPRRIGSFFDIFPCRAAPRIREIVCPGRMESQNPVGRGSRRCFVFPRPNFRVPRSEFKWAVPFRVPAQFHFPVTSGHL